MARPYGAPRRFEVPVIGSFGHDVSMQKYFAATTVVFLLGIILSRVLLLKTKGIKVMHFGEIDKTDFFIPPFAFFYFYLIFAAAFRLPTISTQQIFSSGIVAWVGVCLCLSGLFLIVLSLISFGTSFRIGIDTRKADTLVTSGVFGISRNPMYVAFASILVGQFLIFPNWILMFSIAAGSWLLNRQVLREEDELKRHYGKEYADYCGRVRRYL
jgi:protein-S-isoprenylcysteine O-methyltransferase Ste14